MPFLSYAEPGSTAHSTGCSSFGSCMGMDIQDAAYPLGWSAPGVMASGGQPAMVVTRVNNAHSLAGCLFTSHHCRHSGVNTFAGLSHESHGIHWLSSHRSDLYRLAAALPCGW